MIIQKPKKLKNNYDKRRNFKKVIHIIKYLW